MGNRGMKPKVAIAAGILALCAACGGGGGGASTPTSPAPAPTVPVSGACAALGQTISSSTSIVNGASCDVANTPVVLVNLKASDGFPEGACSGTVIAPRAILTAAHCLPDTASAVQIFLGVGPLQTASAFARHPSWRDSNNTAYDVGVVLMPADIGRAPLPLLLSRDARAGETSVIAGWGKDGAGIPATLRAGSAIVTSVGPLTLQTTFSSTFSSVCQGDSGGPILLQEGGGWAIAGVISANATIACNQGNNFYANIRNPDITSFILDRVPDAARR